MKGASYRATALLLALLIGSACRAGEEAPSLPAPRAGADVLGRVVDATWLEHWLAEPLVLAGPGAPRATLLRWWTDGCPYCEVSLPAIETLRERYGPRGFETLAIYHPKPPHAVPDDEVRAAAEERGYRGPLATDPTWSVLRRIWLDTGARDATSASFLLDAEGRIRWVHPGPIFQPPSETAGDGASAGQAERDLADLERAIQALLAE